MIITKNTILFLDNKNPKFKNQCIMEFKFELAWINSLKEFDLNKFVFGIREKENLDKTINDIILDRKKFLKIILNILKNLQIMM